MKKLWLAVGLLAFVSGLIVIALIANPRGPSEPEYQGRKLTRWLQDLDRPLGSTQRNAIVAIRQMGTNAVPFLVQMLHAKDSPFKRKYMEVLERQHWIDFHFRFDFQKRSDALLALLYLGPDAKAAIPDLANLLKDDPVAGQIAAIVLSQIGPPAVPALESALTNNDATARHEAASALGTLADPSSVSNLLVTLKDPDWMTRSIAADVLRRFTRQANVVVPALINSLDDSNEVFRATVARTLGSFGTDARPAIPKLLIMAADTNSDVSKAATNALKEIDPEAAAKLNGK